MIFHLLFHMLYCQAHYTKTSHLSHFYSYLPWVQPIQPGLEQLLKYQLGVWEPFEPILCYELPVLVQTTVVKISSVE